MCCNFCGYWLNLVGFVEGVRERSRVEKGLEEAVRGGKTLDHVCVRKRTRRDLKTFFNEMSSKKQTLCRAKRLHVVCATQT
ncbi:hypothetical protein Hanom_Chr03g00204531 [Helianthus anomalus]